jgi:hypothetical protein
MTVGLSEHLFVKFTETMIKGKPVISVSATDLKQQEQLEQNSMFRLVSTGVDIDNRIRAETSVQIQHFQTGRYLCHETTVKFDFL